MGYFRLGLTSFSTTTRELRVLDFFGLLIRGPEEILHIFDVSYVQKFMKNCTVNVPETSYAYISKGVLSIGEIKFWST